MSELRVPEQLALPVRGGDLATLHWPAESPGAPVVVLVHGITGNALSWARVAGALGTDVEVFAPDLRGRAGSAGLPGPYGIATHAEDVLALLDAVGADQAVLAGHSMGAFVVAVAAAGVARDRVRGVVLVDGGLPFPAAPGADVETTLGAVLGPALSRLGMTFPDLAAVRAFWAQHPAVGPWVDVPSVAAYLARDVVPTDARAGSGCSHRSAAAALGGHHMTIMDHAPDVTSDGVIAQGRGRVVPASSDGNRRPRPLRRREAADGRGPGRHGAAKRLMVAAPAATASRSG